MCGYKVEVGFVARVTVVFKLVDSVFCFLEFLSFFPPRPVSI